MALKYLKDRVVTQDELAAENDPTFLTVKASADGNFSVLVSETVEKYLREKPNQKIAEAVAEAVRRSLLMWMGIQ